MRCCWLLQVIAVMHELLPREGVQDLPIYALGASVGASFAMALPHVIPIAGAASVTQYGSMTHE
jgi:hypothetical protein